MRAARMHAQPGMAPQFAQPQANTAQVHKRAMQRCTMQQVAGGKTCAAPPNGRGAAASARGSLEKVGIRHLSRLLSACVAAAVELRPPSNCAPLCQAGKKESKRCQESLASAQRWPREARLTRFGVHRAAQNRRAPNTPLFSLWPTPLTARATHSRVFPRQSRGGGARVRLGRRGSMSLALRPYLDCIKATLQSALCIENFASQIVERHNKPEIEVG